MSISTLFRLIIFHSEDLVIKKDVLTVAVRIGKALPKMVDLLPSLSEIYRDVRLPAMNPGDPIAAIHDISSYRNIT